MQRFHLTVLTLAFPALLLTAQADAKKKSESVVDATR